MVILHKAILSSLVFIVSFFILQISSEYTTKSDDKMKDSQIK